MTPRISKFVWSDIASAPEQPGVYAWYYAPELTRFDLDKTISSLEALDPTERGRAEEIIRDLLENRLFGYFREDPYEARIEGPLKPNYSGQLHHQMGISGSLVERLAERPDRLHVIREVLEVSAPMFASPLYMGMSDGLRGRLSKHKSLIEKFRENRSWDTNGDTREDAGFARQIAKRRIPPERLFVITCVVNTDENIHVDIENILNRIYYPILGRN